MRPGTRIAQLAAREPVLARVWATVLALVAVTGVVTGNLRVFPYLVVCTVVTAVIATADVAARFSRGLLVCLLLLACLHMAGGLLPSPDGVLYDGWIVRHVLRYDQVVHAFGSATGTWASWQLIGAYLGPPGSGLLDETRMPPRAQALIACLGGLGKGALNEIVEFLATRITPDTAVGGYENTGWDLVFDLVGCAAMAVLLVQARMPRCSPALLDALRPEAVHVDVPAAPGGDVVSTLGGSGDVRVDLGSINTQVPRTPEHVEASTPAV